MDVLIRLCSSVNKKIDSTQNIKSIDVFTIRIDIGMIKRCRLRPDATEYGDCSEFTLFASYPAGFKHIQMICRALGIIYKK